MRRNLSVIFNEFAKRCFFTLALVYLGLSTADAELVLSLKPEQQAIMDRVVAGELNNSVHQEFWSTFTKTEREEAADLRDAVRAEFPISLEWQKEIWRSVRESNLAGQVVRTEKYLDLKEQMANRSFAHQGIENAELFIELAAEGGSLDTPNGKVELNAQTAETVLINLEGALSRLEKLFDPYWRFEIDQASAENYASIVERQPDWQSKAATCLRFWNILAASVELSFKEEARKIGSYQKNKFGRSLVNIKWREIFILKVIEEYGLKELSDEAYAYGAGVDLLDKNGPPAIARVCGKEINEFLRLAPGISDASLKEAKAFIKSLN